MLRGNKVVGVVREAYNKWERRAPLCPVHVQRLARDGIQVLVQPSDRRVFTNSEYEKAGATITEDLSPASYMKHAQQQIYFNDTAAIEYRRHRFIDGPGG